MAKLDSQTPARISNLDYNAIRNKAVTLLGPGLGSRGYGQATSSSAVTSGNTILKSHWDLLRYDLINVKTHQDGIEPPIVTLQPGDVIRYGASNPNTNYETIAAQADLARFNIGANQLIISSKANTSYSSSWSTQASCTLTIVFGTANEARYFFNSGGKIQFFSSRSAGSSTPQNNAWTELLAAVGTQAFGGATPSLANFYTLTSSYQPFYQLAQSTPYSNNFCQLAALCNVANNSTGTATSVTFKITWQDNYANTADLVNGTLSIAISELKATGTLIPSGSPFTITSPSYSLSSITAS
jgi:hypothetical protein